MTTEDALLQFDNHLYAAGRSPRTITSYVQAITRTLHAMDLVDDTWSP